MCLFVIVCRIAMAISRAHSFKQYLISLFRLIRPIISLFSYIVKPTIVPIIGHFSIFAKFREILRKCQNSANKGKFHGLVRNSMTHGKLWTLQMNVYEREPFPVD